MNCNVSRRHCSYEDLISKAPTLARRPRLNKPEPTPKQNDDPAANSSASSHAGGGVDSPPVNTFHLELYHHFVTNISEIFGFNTSVLDVSAVEIAKHTLTAPFLMNQILALSALHLSVIHPAQQCFYKNHATQLQNHAIAGFNGAELGVRMENCVPMFIFSSILALHMLSENLVFHSNDFEAFLDHFAQSLRLHSGIRAVTFNSWHVLLESPLRSLLEMEGKALDQDVSGHQCADLLQLLNTLPLDQDIKDIYQQTIDGLQKAFDGSSPDSSRLSTIGPIISWPVTISPGYIDLLSERRPEALVILSYFGALLHIHKNMWMFGKGGKFVVSSVNNYLGSSWEYWLRLPNRLIEEGSLTP